MRRLVSRLLTPLAVIVFTASTAQSAWLFAHVDWEQISCEMEAVRLAEAKK